MKKLLVIIFLLFGNLLAIAQYNIQDSLAVVKSHWKTTKFKGKISTKSIHFNKCELFGANQSVNMIEIAPNSPYKFDLAYQAKELITLDSFVNIHQAVAGINGNFFDVKNGGSMDFIRSNKEIISVNAIYKSGSRAEHQKSAILFNNNKLSISQWNGDEKWEFDLKGEDVMLTGPLLRIDNKDAVLAKNSFNADRAPRSLIGIKADGTVLMICIDGRSIEAEGMTIKEEQDLIRWLGCVDAINLDGGGSSTLFFKKASKSGIINYPSDNKVFDHLGLRKIANAIILVE